MTEQLLLFQDSPDEIQSRKIKTLEEKYDNLRKSQHARISTLQKEIKELKSDLDLIKSNICKGQVFL